MANVYWRKRTQANITAIDMAEKLGIPLDKYREIEMGDRDMPKHLMDLFHKTVKEAKEQPNIVKLEKVQREKDYEEWIESILANDKELLKKYMVKFNIKSYSALARLLGYSQPVVTTYIGKPEQMSYPFKKNLYDFFHNELNIQVKENEEKIVERKNKRKNCSFLSKKEKEKVQEWLDSEGISLGSLTNMLNVNYNTFMGYWSKSRRMPNEIKARLLELAEGNEQTIITAEPIVEKPELLSPTMATPYEKYPEEEKEMKTREEKNSTLDLESRIEALEEEHDKLVKEHKKLKEIEEYKAQVDEAASKMEIFRKSLIEAGMPEELANSIVFEQFRAAANHAIDF